MLQFLPNVRGHGHIRTPKFGAKTPKIACRGKKKSLRWPCVNLAQSLRKRHFLLITPWGINVSPQYFGKLLRACGEPNPRIWCKNSKDCPQENKKRSLSETFYLENQKKWRSFKANSASQQPLREIFWQTERPTSIVEPQSWVQKLQRLPSGEQKVVPSRHAPLKIPDSGPRISFLLRFPPNGRVFLKASAKKLH